MQMALNNNLDLVIKSLYINDLHEKTGEVKTSENELSRDM